MKNNLTYKHIHFVGIKGVGMAALARAAKDKGIAVSGSDVAEEFITTAGLKTAGIKPTVGFATQDLPQEVDLVVYGPAHSGVENEQVQAAKDRGVRTITYGQAIQELLNDKKIIAVAGTHGKTTTTAMLAMILYQAGLEPSWIVGTGEIPGLSQSGRWGKGEYAVVEADEYVDEINGKPKFLHLNPFGLIITSLDWDHPDAFPTHKLFVNAFHKLIKRVNPHGILVLRGDEKELRRLAKSFHSTTRWILPKVLYPGIKLTIPGEFNRLNAAFAARMAHELGVPQKAILSSLLSFKGVQRRLELKGELAGWTIYDDYAHHPTEIKSSLQALRQLYPHAFICVLFQAHTYSRTKSLLADFGKSFTSADQVLVAPIFASARETDTGEKIDLVGEISQNHANVQAVKNPLDLKLILDSTNTKNNQQKIFITMGAGNIYEWVKPKIT